jgi:HD-GYP domain-containing protein (c-di-GMP phosphodiesterase class II)
MSDQQSAFVDVNALEIGHYVHLDVGWLAHPFPSGSFKIVTAKQIETIQSLGLKQVRVEFSKSELLGSTAIQAETVKESSKPVEGAADGAQREALSEAQKAQLERKQALSEQQHSLMLCERRFTDATRQYRKTLEKIPVDPLAAAATAQSLVDGFLQDILSAGDTAIRLLTQVPPDRTSLHPVNVTVVALLLGKAMGLNRSDLSDLGMAAFLHDIGKSNVPERVRHMDQSFTSAETRLYQDHVAQSVILGRSMGLSKSVLLATSQHHEMADGSGFPLALKSQSTALSGRILALVNRFDNLCNPVRNGAALTPHEALSLLFAQHKHRFDGAVLSAFIRMMGVYPPGSVVQLIDDRHALVVAVNSAKPLKPRVIVFEAGQRKDQSLILDLEQVPQLGIRRSMKPSSLPTAVLDFLEPAQRVCYFFENLPAPETEAA